MKTKLLISACLLALLLSFGLWAMAKNKGFSEHFLNGTTMLAQQIRSGSWQDAGTLLSSLQEEWERQEELLEIWVDHVTVDQINLAFRQVAVGIEQKEPSWALTLLEDLKEGCEHLYHRDAFRLGNIF